MDEAWNGNDNQPRISVYGSVVGCTGENSWNVVWSIPRLVSLVCDPCAGTHCKAMFTMFTCDTYLCIVFMCTQTRNFSSGKLDTFPKFSFKSR